ncbi:MAG: phosphatidate cytidylyltransferase [Alphaproteobacteria bacterium]|nr:phosphatidate cytidylyltransferase [Alphaproteobacteria bacterium]
MNNTTKRILTALVMIAIAGIAALAEHFGIPAVQWLAVAIAAIMVFETMRLKIKDKKLCGLRVALGAWLIFVGISAYFVGAKPWVMLLLLVTIVAADVGAWFFGHLLGGDKMWEKLSPGKTWSGQIAGIICGTLATVLYGLLGTDTFLPQLMWIGISVSLLSQYGDLAASWVKRKLGIKDFGNTLPGHGGLLDRFDGWIFVLPIVWLVMI